MKITKVSLPADVEGVFANTFADLAWRDSMERTDTWHKSIEINPVTLDVLPVDNFLWQFCTGFVKEESAVYATVGRT